MKYTFPHHRHHDVLLKPKKSNPQETKDTTGASSCSSPWTRTRPLSNKKTLQQPQAPERCTDSGPKAPVPTPQPQQRRRPLLLPTKRVRFGKAFLYEHPIIPGDNPGGSHGVPLTIAWECVGHQVVDAIALQDGRQAQSVWDGSGSSSRPMAEDRLHLSAAARQELLQGLGYTRQELVPWCKAATVARAQRRKTVETLGLLPLHQALERTRKGVVHLLLPPKQRQERQRLKQWRSVAHGPASSLRTTKSLSDSWSSNSTDSTSSILTAMILEDDHEAPDAVSSRTSTNNNTLGGGGRARPLVVASC